jgi:acetyl-CoA C-acetyltransferase
MPSVIVSGARTPMGRLLGNLKDMQATQLGSAAIKAASSEPAWHLSRCNM